MENILYTKSIFKNKNEEDGNRISVMSRHTLNDGITPDKRIIEGVSFDEWMRELAPPGKLVGSYYRNEISWGEYGKQYLEFLRSENIAPLVVEFAERCTKETITLLCVEESAEKCHRKILAEEICRLQPGLQLSHR